MLTQRLVFGVVILSMATLVVLLDYLYMERPLVSPIIKIIQNSATRRLQGSSDGIYFNLQIQSSAVAYRSVEPEALSGNDFLTEEEALKDDPITDIKKTVSISKSIVQLKGSQKTYSLGEKIEVKIILRNGDGKNRSRGGDQLRVRIFNMTQKAFAPGHVLDHNNGSYTAIVPTLWSGRMMISVILAYRREYVRAIYHIRKQLFKALKAIETLAEDTIKVYGLPMDQGMDRPAVKALVLWQSINVDSALSIGTQVMGAVFNKGSLQEHTACHPEKRWLTQYSDVCNLTLENGGMSWYCGKPRRKNISCQDWSFPKYILPAPKLPLTKAEGSIYKPGWEVFPDIAVEVEGTIPQKDDLPPCHSFPRHLLWNRKEPTGYFYNDRWRLLHCQTPNTTSYIPCLRGKRLMISGDSTTRQWYSFLSGYTQCKQITEKWTHKKWHRKSVCVDPSLNFTLEWLPHAQPLFPGKQFDSLKYRIDSIASNIDSIGYAANVVFVIHMHMHLTAFHHSVFRGRMKQISRSVRNLIKINPNVTFMIKASHTYKINDDRGNRLDDYFGYVYKDIMIEEFGGLHDKIVFMDQKDMTIAKALIHNHPPEDVVREAVFQMFNYFCEGLNNPHP